MKFIFILLTTVVPLPAAADVPGVLTVAKNLLVLRGNAPRVHVQTVRQVENIIPSVAAQQALLAGKKASKLAIKKGNTLAKVKPPQSRPPPLSDRTLSENSIRIDHSEPDLDNFFFNVIPEDKTLPKGKEDPDFERFLSKMDFDPPRSPNRKTRSQQTGMLAQ